MKRITSLSFVVVALLAALPSMADARTRRADADARHCLEQPTNYLIIKCAERYL
jgi:hypothetical protein